MMLNFAEALTEAKRKARLSGRDVSRNEVAGIVSGYAEGSADRLFRAKQVELRERALNEEIAAAKAQDKQAEKSNMISAVGGGAALGGYLAAGTAMGGPVGAVIGGAAGLIASKCIIITACTDPHSYEVNLARIYRDEVLTEQCLGGYYAICPLVVPLIHRSPMFKHLIKRVLVDRLVDEFEHHFGIIERRKYRTTRFIVPAFLGFCDVIGSMINVKPWLEAHR